MAVADATREDMRALVQSSGWKSLVVECFRRIQWLDQAILSQKESRDEHAAAKKELMLLLAKPYELAGIGPEDNPFTGMDLRWVRERLRLPEKMSEGTTTGTDDEQVPPTAAWLPPQRRSGAV